MAKKPLILDLGANGEVRLPDEALSALGVQPGEKLSVKIDTRHKALRIERHVDDPWSEALKQKEQQGFEDILGAQKQRDDEASDLFDRRLKDAPKEERRPEDDPDLWR
jgi:antitoxin component of MazEF toxin-antitoxin module